MLTNKKSIIQFNDGTTPQQVDRKKIMSEEDKKEKEEKIKKGDIDSPPQEDIELIVDPENPEKIKKHYGTKLVDGGGCTAQV
jgi:NACalpha-BTF3-like transcription factor